LKTLVWYRDGADLVVVSQIDEQITLEDPDGQLEGLLELVADAGGSLEELLTGCAARWPSVGADEVLAALAALEDMGLLVDDDEAAPLSPWQQERFFSNLVFFDGYASSARSAVGFQRRLLDAHVVVLGLGGAGFLPVMNLVGLGVGRLTLLDSDTVELRNFVRQFIYRADDVGRPKAECAAAWVKAFDPKVKVSSVHRRISGVVDIALLIEGADLVIAAVDQPMPEISRWVNEACVSAGVPFVQGGASRRHVFYWSVDPGRSPCWTCREHTRDSLPIEVAREHGADASRMDRFMGPNSSVGPTSSLLGSLMAMEAMRYLTGFAAPVAAGARRLTDIVSGSEEHESWAQWPECPACAKAPTAPAAHV
jgi:molybdopterin-synthase adenylyltransferase